MRKTPAAFVIAIVSVLLCSTMVCAAEPIITEVERMYPDRRVERNPEWKPQIYPAGFNGAFQKHWFDLSLYDDVGVPDPNTFIRGSITLSVGYPQNTGDTNIDAVVKNFAKELFMRRLPIDPETIESTDILTWQNQLPVDYKKHYYAYELIDLFIVNRLHAQGLPFERYKLYQENLYFGTRFFVPRYDNCFLVIAFIESTGDLNMGRSSDSLDFLNYDLKNRKLITLNDLVPNQKTLPDIVNKLKELALAKFGMDDEHVEYNIYSNFDSESKYFSFAPSDASEWFKAAIMPEGLVFDIPYCYIYNGGWPGQVFVTISKEELAALGINTQYWEE